MADRRDLRDARAQKEQVGHRHTTVLPARTLGLELHVTKAGNERNLDAAFVDFTQSNAQALLIAGDAFFLVAREKIVALAARHAIPMMYNNRDFVLAGGLASYAVR